MNTTHVRTSRGVSRRVFKAITPIVIAAVLVAVTPVPARAQEGKEFTRGVVTPILGALVVVGCLALVGLVMPRPPLSAEPSAVDFANVTVGSDASRVVKLLNKSKKTIAVEAIAVVSDQFGLQEPPPTPHELKPGESMDVLLAFKPALKRDASARLEIRTKEAGSGKQRTMKIGLKGRGSN